MLLVSDLMSEEVKTLRENASVGRAHADMQSGRLRHFPVLNKRGEVTGLVSSLDVAKALAVEGHGRAIAVRDVMSRRVIKVNESLLAYQAARMMRLKKIGSLPVISSDGRLVGIITETDFLAVAERALQSRDLVRKR